MTETLQQPALQTSLGFQEPPTLVRGSILNFLDLAVSLVAAIAVSVVVARSLGPDLFGLYSLVMSVVSFTFLVARFGINDTLNRYVAELLGRGERSTAAILALRGLLLSVLVAGFAALLLGLLSGLLAGFFRAPQLRSYLLLGALTLVPMIAVGVLRAVLRGLQRWRYFVQLNLVTSPLWVLACWVVLWRGWGVAGLLIVGLVAEVIQLAVLGWWVRKEIGVPALKTPVPALLRSRMVRYNFAVLALALLQIVVWRRSELFFLGHFSHPDQVAYYSLPIAMTERITALLPGSVLGVLLPGLTFAMGASDPDRFGRLFNEALRYLTILTIPICLFAIPTAGAVIQLLYGSQYSPAVPILQVLSLAIPFAVLADATGSALLGVERQSWLLKVGIGAAVVGIGLDFLLIPSLGAMGAAVAKVSAQALWGIAAFVPLARRVTVRTWSAGLMAAATAAPLACLLALAGYLGAPPVAMVTAGAAACLIYLGVLDILSLLHSPSLLAKLSPALGRVRR